MRLRSAILRLHLVVALLAGAFLLVVGATGSIMAFEPELDHLLHAQRTYVAPSGTPRTIAELGAIAARAAGEAKPTGYLLSAAPNLSWQVLFRGRGIFINQYTGDVLGIREPGPDVLSRIHQLHIRLLVQNQSDIGKTIVKWAGVGLLVLLVSGVYLWWPARRLAIRTSGPAWRVAFDVHNTVGVVSFVFLLAFAVTGIAIGFDDALSPAIYRATGSEPFLMYGRQPHVDVKPSGAPIGPDRAVEIARAALPGAMPISVNVPAPTGVYAISARYPEDLTPGGRSRVLIDQYSGRVLAAEGSRTAPAGSRLITLNRAIHTGDVFGMPSKIVMSLASLAVVLQLVTGLVIWLRR